MRKFSQPQMSANDLWMAGKHISKLYLPQFKISLSFSKRQLFPNVMNQPFCLTEGCLQETSYNTITCYWELLELDYLQVRTCCFLVNCYLYCFSNLLFRYDNRLAIHGPFAPLDSHTTMLWT